ncbi:AAA family ATPase [uncultured Methanolobus sp.]|uniref:AAA family ATPase n=1 Tax=uncultured Methanolobus sp. TaxID=218300 RepID=UPI002AAB5C86|nr:AAA family ATPase [uncultured Methanolobus sp.]
MDQEYVNTPDQSIFPFTAILAQENAKKALMCAMVCPDINGVLLSGETGCAKSTLARSTGNLLTNGEKIVTLPLNVTCERVVGTLDIERTVTEGDGILFPGLLHEADKNILLVDDINLFDDSIAETILNASEKGSYFIEREGLSGEHNSDFTLIATMNPSEKEISPHLLDRFDICVMAENVQEREKRLQIIKKCLEYEKDPKGFRKQSRQEIQELKDKIKAAKERLQYVILPEGHIELIAGLALELGVQGHRGDLALSRVSKTLAALDRRDKVTFEDIKEAALLTLEHRRTGIESSDRQNETDRESIQDSNAQNDDHSNNDTPAAHSKASPDIQNKDESYAGDENHVNHRPDNSDAEQIFTIGEAFKVVDYLPVEKRMKLGRSAGKGKRKNVSASRNSGRYVSFREVRGNVTDIAFDATLRAAAPYQRSRDGKGLAVALEKQDLREKVRLRKKGTSILFLVDASRSMGARKRMIAVKGAILSLLKDAYQKRDSVGMMVFYSDVAELLLPPTRSVDLASHKLKELPVGGKTPLALGLSRSLELMTGMGIRSLEDDAVIILISDCRANIPLKGENALNDVLEIAKFSQDMPVRFVVVDTETGFPRIGLAEKVAKALSGSYFRLEELDAEKLATSVHATIHGSMHSSAHYNESLIGGY